MTSSRTRQPRIGICAAFRPGLEIITHVLDRACPVEFIATCHRDDPATEAAIAEKGMSAKKLLFRKIDANHPDFITMLREREIDLMILAWWPDIIKKDACHAPRIGWLNLHPTLLPYGRGKHGYYWSIVEGTPFGATIHLIDEGVDTGPVLFQREIAVTIEDTGETLYDKGVRTVIDLFKEKTEDIFNLGFQPQKQDDAAATAHHSREIEPHSRIDLDKTYRARDLINILRGRTFWKGPAASFSMDGKTYHVRVSIEEAGREQR